MTPKLICENYRCKLGPDRDIRVFGMTEYTDGIRSAPGLYVAIVHESGAPPQKFDTDSFDAAVALIAHAFGEPEDTVRNALLASASPSNRMSDEKLPLPVVRQSLIQRIKTVWRNGIRKFSAFS